MDVEGLSDRQRRAVENVIRALKARDWETAKLILDEEFDEETREKVISYLEDLGFQLPIKRRSKKVREVRGAAPMRPVLVEQRPKKIIPPPSRDFRLPPRTSLSEGLPRKEYDLALIPLASAVYSLVKQAKFEVLMMSNKIHPKILKELRRLSKSGLEVKVLLSPKSCNEMKELGKRNMSCFTKDLIKKAILNVPPLLLAINMKCPFDMVSFALGAVAGINVWGLWAITLSTMVLNNPGLYYAGLPWALKGASITSMLKVIKEMKLPRSKVEVRVLENVPYSIVVVDRKKAISSYLPFSWKGDVLSKVYRSSAEEPLREFRAFWEAASFL